MLIIPNLAIALGYSVAVALGMVVYAYAGYPLVLWALSSAFGRKPARPEVSDQELPRLSLLIAAYNEARHIRERIENALDLDYPEGKLEIVIASDGSSDETAAIARDYGWRGVRLLNFRARRGKSSVLNEAIPLCNGEVVMLSDANTLTEPDAARNLAAWFRDPAVGVVCGKLILVDPAGGRNVDGLYWKYETFLKIREARLGGLLGSNGGIYAVRKSVVRPIPPATIVDDFVLPLLARQETGCAIVYDAGAVATEETPASIVSEFQRRARIGAGGFQALGLLWRLVSPRQGWLAFTFLNHKVLRWACPFLLIYAAVANVAWVALCMPHVGDVHQLPVPALALAVQFGFYVASLLSGMLPAGPKVFKVFRLAAMFTSMNAALAVGFWRWLNSQQRPDWARTDRDSVPLAAPTLPRAAVASAADADALPELSGPGGRSAVSRAS